MSHIAVIAPPFFSHYQALQALGGVLAARGHRVTFFHQPDAAALMRDEALGFVPVGSQTHPVGHLQHVLCRAARPGGPWGVRRVVRDVAASTDMLCSTLPATFDAHGITAVLADQMEAAGAIVAAGTGRPWVSVACAVPINPDPDVPPPYLGWGYDDSAWGRHRNRGGVRVARWIMAPHDAVLAKHARAFGLPVRRGLEAWLSPHGQISQGTASFDFPRAQPPAGLRYVGCLHGGPTAHADLPARDARPLVFASFGTMQGGRFDTFRRVARACRSLGVQLWVAHCGGLDGAQAAALRAEGADWVTDFVPQAAVLAQAHAVVTHAGLNTVLESLCAGVPLLTLPMAFDQPGVAARVAYRGAGLRADPQWSSIGALRGALERLLTDPAFAERAALLGADVRAAGGATAAADVVEAALRRHPRHVPASARPEASRMGAPAQGAMEGVYL
ncbi:glycosyltransferase family 1 protein [Achromobacter sp. GG226]|uniref:glycosyltransferase n=1 Tax=Verticiella alkaliphila TaxID=2779529 RepID=UPI001C0D0E8B|nr:glycosyltransferase [Verticiella sp. GG226]MBU4612793.1 glycosyltransferase family 1 protein [Verticiella sp. GG226]